jgi:hypothetical protein
VFVCKVVILNAIVFVWGRLRYINEMCDSLNLKIKLNVGWLRAREFLYGFLQFPSENVD